MTKESFDPDKAAAELRLVGPMKIFALALARGANQWEAGVEAGLAGAPATGEQPSSSFRKKCSVKARSQRVCKFIARSQGREDLPIKADGPLTDAERRLILADAARKGTGGIRVRAALADYQIGKGEAEHGASDDPMVTLRQIAKTSPAIAGILAGRHGIPLDLDSLELKQRATAEQERIAKNWIRDNPEQATSFADFFLRPSNVVSINRGRT